jgi:hypothetical protein
MLTIPQYSPYRTAAKWIAELHRTLGQSGIALGDLPDYLIVSLKEVIAGHHFSKEALAYLVDFKNYDSEAILKRNSTYQGWPKPRIVLSVEITTHGNLSAKWYPRKYTTKDGSVTDWRVFDEVPSGWERPVNELMFVHGIDSLISKSIEPEYEPVRHYVSYAVIAAYRELKELLEAAFEVEISRDLEISNDESGHMRWYDFSVDHRKQAEAHEWIENFTHQFGISLSEFRSEIEDSANRSSGDGINYQKVSKKLRARAPQMTPGQVEKINGRIAEIQEHWRLLHHWIS